MCTEGIHLLCCCFHRSTFDQSPAPRMNRRLPRGRRTFWVLHLDSGDLELHRQRPRRRPAGDRRRRSSAPDWPTMASPLPPPRPACGSRQQRLQVSDPAPSRRFTTGRRQATTHAQTSPQLSIGIVCGAKLLCLNTPAQLDAVRHAKGCHWNKKGGQPTMAPVPAPLSPPSALVLCPQPKALDKKAMSRWN